MFLSTKSAVRETCDIHNRTYIDTYHACILQCLAVLHNCPIAISVTSSFVSWSAVCAHFLQSWGVTFLGSSSATYCVSIVEYFANLCDMCGIINTYQIFCSLEEKRCALNCQCQPTDDISFVS